MTAEDQGVRAEPVAYGAAPAPVRQCLSDKLAANRRAGSSELLAGGDLAEVGCDRLCLGQLMIERTERRLPLLPG